MKFIKFLIWSLVVLNLTTLFSVNCKKTDSFVTDFFINDLVNQFEKLSLDSEINELTKQFAKLSLLKSVGLKECLVKNIFFPVNKD